MANIRAFLEKWVVNYIRSYKKASEYKIRLHWIKFTALLLMFGDLLEQTKINCCGNI